MAGADREQAGEASKCDIKASGAWLVRPCNVRPCIAAAAQPLTPRVAYCSMYVCMMHACLALAFASLLSMLPRLPGPSPLCLPHAPKIKAICRRKTQANKGARLTTTTGGKANV